MSDTGVRTDVADFDFCDIHETAYRKAGYCKDCRIEELEAALNEIVHGSSDGMTHGGIKCRAIAKAALGESDE